MRAGNCSLTVEFTTPGRPCENGAHEQFHRVYQAEVAQTPAQRRSAEQRRSNRWLRQDHGQRAPEALGMAVPATHYRKSWRRMPAALTPWTYPKGWGRRWVKGNGEISWHGRRRFVGEAFVRDYVGLRLVNRGVWRGCFGPIWVGALDEQERGNTRTAKYRTRQKPRCPASFQRAPLASMRPGSEKCSPCPENVCHLCRENIHSAALPWAHT